MKNKSHYPPRLSILFFCVFLAFSALVIRLGTVQVINGETYKIELGKQEKRRQVTAISVPRGKIFDREGKRMVDNAALRIITYKKPEKVTSKDILKVARDLTKVIEIKQEDIDKLTETDKKDFWIELNEKRAEKKTTKQDKQKLRAKDIEGKAFDKKIDELRRERITDKELNEFTPQDLKVLAIKSKMSSAYGTEPQIIKKDVTEKEFAIVSENLDKFPGIDATVDWERSYSNGDLFRSVLGNVTSSDEGLPKDLLDYYLVRDYGRNERVGKSYIEKQYEDVLHGTKGEVQMIPDKSGNKSHSEILSRGKSGKNVVLTIDIELQKKVEEIIEKRLTDSKSSEPLLDRAFVVMMNPKNGQILSMAGKKLEDKDGKTEVKDYALGTMTSSYELGSAVKGATLLTGFQTGAIQPGTIFYDTPMKLKGTKTKASWNREGFGNIDDLRALQISSNVYMFNTALRIAGINYVPNMSLDIKQATFDKMRYYFSQFGLGVPTGIDLPNEIIGQKGRKDNMPGFLIDYSIGQYDTYTPLQLAQYISTIANGGYRMKPQILQEILEQAPKKDDIGKVIKSVEPTVLNRVDMKKEYIDRVKEGFKMVFQEGDGTGVKYFKNDPNKPAGKTGTAQTVYGGDSKIGINEKGERMQCYNITLAGYAPYDDPEVAFSVVVPWVENDHAGINSEIGKDILDAYFDLKKQRINGETTNTGGSN
ncbi:penicillin-binding protein 2 (plasmid) [Bacillus mycoides]|nr:penicillin-binding protein 2 [Bacillus mycoides]